MSNLSNKVIENTYISVLNIGTESTPNGALTSALSTITDGLGNKSSLSIALEGNGSKVTGPLSIEGDVFIGTNCVLQFGATGENTDNTRIQRVNGATNETELRVIVGDDRNSSATPVDKFTVGGLDSSAGNVYRPVLTVAMSGGVNITPQPASASKDILTVPAGDGSLAPGWPSTLGGGIRTWDIRCQSVSGVNGYFDNIVFPGGDIATSANNIVWLSSPISLGSTNNNTYIRTPITGLTNSKIKSVIIQVSQGRIQSTDGTTTQVYFKSTSGSSLEFTAMLHYSNDGNRNSGFVGQGTYPVSFDSGELVIFVKHTRNGNFGTPDIRVMGYVL